MSRISSIQQKMMKVIMLTSGIVLFMTCLAFFIYEYIAAHEVARRQLSTLGQIIATNSTAALAFDSRDDATEILHALTAEINIKAAVLYDQNGKMFAKYPANVSPSDVPGSSGQTGYQFHGSFIEGYTSVVQDGTNLGTLYLRFDMQAMYHRFALYGIIAALFTLISFVFAWFISKQLQKSISSPILQLAEIAKTVSDNQNYSVRAVKRSNDEVGTLTDAFNHMLTRIEIQNAEITSLNQNLEQKVRQRTHALKTSNEELMRQTELNETILDASIDLIAVFDTELRYVTMNKHAETIYNTTKKDVVGKYIGDVFPQTLQTGMVDDLKNALKGEIVKHINYVSGVTRRHQQNFYIPLKDKNDNVYQVLAIAHDITDIMEANEKLRELNAELEKSNRELEQFAYVASHDLQEPLRKIQTFSELAEMNIANQESVRKYLAKVSSSANRMTELIKAVLNYSRISKSEAEFIPVNLNDILASICTDLELLIQEKNAVINYKDLPEIAAVPLQMHQLFMNLVTNSLKFNDGVPIISIASTIINGAERKDSQLAMDKKYVQISFSDNGIGFDQKFSEKIFSIFQRLHTDKRIEGTGIGLAVCKKIVENHSGEITVESTPGKGTTFVIYLPWQEVRTTQLTNTSSTNTHAF